VQVLFQICNVSHNHFLPVVCLMEIGFVVRPGHYYQLGSETPVPSQLVIALLSPNLAEAL